MLRYKKSSFNEGHVFIWAFCVLKSKLKSTPSKLLIIYRHANGPRNRNIGPLVDHCGPDFYVSAIGWIVENVCTDSHPHQMLNPDNFGDFWLFLYHHYIWRSLVECISWTQHVIRVERRPLSVSDKPHHCNLHYFPCLLWWQPPIVSRIRENCLPPISVT